MNKILILLFSIFMIGNLSADQTFDQTTAIPSELYYQVPITLKIIESGSPTDFYVSINNSSTWNSISNTFGWGESNNSLTWTPNFIQDSLKFGIHTGIRNSNTFSSIPTDSSDQYFSVSSGTINFEMSETSFWYKDYISIKWNSEKETLPSDLILEMMESSSTFWTVIDTINIDAIDSLIWYNTKKEDISLRLTYTGLEYGLVLDSISLSYLNPSLTFTNKTEIENTIYDDSVEVVINFETERITEGQYIAVHIQENGNNIEVIHIPYNSNTFSYLTKQKSYTYSEILFYSELGYFLGSVEISSQYKYFEIAPLDDVYFDNEKIEIDWTSSSHFENVQIEVFKNSNTFSEVLNFEWPLKKNMYSYKILENDSTLRFRLTVKDEYSTISLESKTITIKESCREDEYLEIIKELEGEIEYAYMIIDSLMFNKDTIYVVLVKDDLTSVEDEIIFNIKNLEVLNIKDGILSWNEEATHIFISDLSGNIVITSYMKSEINVSNLANGIYFLVISNGDENKVYKFLK